MALGTDSMSIRCQAAPGAWATEASGWRRVSHPAGKLGASARLRRPPLRSAEDATCPRSATIRPLPAPQPSASRNRVMRRRGLARADRHRRQIERDAAPRPNSRPRPATPPLHRPSGRRCSPSSRRSATSCGPASTTTTAGARTRRPARAPSAARRAPLPLGPRLRSSCLAILRRHGRLALHRAPLPAPPLRLRGRQQHPGQGPGRRHGLRGRPGPRPAGRTRRLRGRRAASARAGAAR